MMEIQMASTIAVEAICVLIALFGGECQTIYPEVTWLSLPSALLPTENLEIDLAFNASRQFPFEKHIGALLVLADFDGVAWKGRVILEIDRIFSNDGPFHVADLLAHHEHRTGAVAFHDELLFLDLHHLLHTIVCKPNHLPFVGYHLVEVIFLGDRRRPQDQDRDEGK